MKTAAKPKEEKAQTPAKKPAPKPKITLGLGKHLAFVSDALFDDDLK